MEIWYTFTNKLIVMIPKLVLSESAPEPKAGKPCGWEGGMLTLEGSNPAHPAVATQDAHAMWYGILPRKNIISHRARSQISFCSAATPLSCRCVKTQRTSPKHVLAAMKSFTLPLELWTGRDCSTVAVLSRVYQPVLDDQSTIKCVGENWALFWKSPLDQPDFTCSTNKKPLWGHFSVCREQMVKKRNAIPFPVASVMCEVQPLLMVRWQGLVTPKAQE